MSGCKTNPRRKAMKKKWMNPRRNRGIVIAPEYHLIVTEGTKTEPNYFNALKDEINEKYPGRVSIKVEGAGEGTIKLLERAKKIVIRSTVEYKHVWLIYDKDDFPESDFDRTAFSCKALSAPSVTYHALWSNQCVEYWFLLHYNLLDSDIIRDEYYPKLSEYLKCKYQKNSNHSFFSFSTFYRFSRRMCRGNDRLYRISIDYIKEVRSGTPEISFRGQLAYILHTFFSSFYTSFRVFTRK